MKPIKVHTIGEKRLIENGSVISFNGKEFICFTPKEGSVRDFTDSVYNNAVEIIREVEREEKLDLLQHVKGVDRNTAERDLQSFEKKRR